MSNEFNNKRYFWIKLKTSFLTSDAVDFLMSQKDGANYVVLYQVLCLKTINTEGALIATIGEIMIPFNIDKIVRDCKWFSRDTVTVALELFKSLGLVFLQDNGTLKISNFDDIVGSESQSNKYKKDDRKRLEKFQLDSNKSIEYRDKIIDKELELDNKPLPLKGSVGIKARLIALLDDCILSDSMKSQLGTWLEYKHYKYELVGFRSLITLTTKNVDSYGEDTVIGLIEESMANSYQGITWNKLGMTNGYTNAGKQEPKMSYDEKVDQAMRELQEEGR